MDSEQFKRIPFTVEDISNASTAMNGSLLFDHANGELYLKDINGQIKKVSEETTNTLLGNLYDEIKGGVSPDGDTLYKISEKIKSLNTWILSNSNIVGVDIDNITKLIRALKGIEDVETSLENLVDITPSKILSTNDFTNELKEKLDSIPVDANYYIHPLDKQCDYESPLKSVNGQLGNVVITKEELGLDSVEENANYYEHSEFKECGNGVDRVYSKTGDVITKKRYVDLPFVENYEVATQEDIEKYVNDKYLTNKNLNSFLDGLLDSILTGPGVLGRTVTFITDPPDVNIKMLVRGKWLTGHVMTGIPPGIYVYIIDHDTMTDIFTTDKVVVKGSDVIVTAYLKRYIVTFDTIPPNTEIKVKNGNDYYLGKTHILYPGKYEYEAYIDESYKAIKESFEVQFSDNTVLVSLVPLYVIEIKPNVSGCSISFNDREYIAPIRVPSGVYKYTLNKDGYLPYENTIDVSVDAIIEVTLLKKPIIEFITIPNRGIVNTLVGLNVNKISENKYLLYPNESYTYTISGFGVAGYTGSILTKPEDEKLIIYLTEVPYVSFNVQSTENVTYTCTVNDVITEDLQFEVSLGDVVVYSFQKYGYYTISNMLIISDIDNIINVSLVKIPVLTINPTPSDSTVVVKIGELSHNGNTHLIEVPSTCNITCSKPGFISRSVEQYVERDTSVNIILTEECVFTISPTPSDALCYINKGSSWMAMVDNEYVGAIGELVGYRVYKHGYLYAEDTITLDVNPKNLNITLSVAQTSTVLISAIPNYYDKFTIASHTPNVNGSFNLLPGEYVVNVTPTYPDYTKYTPLLDSQTAVVEVYNSDVNKNVTKTIKITNPVTVPYTDIYRNEHTSISSTESTTEVLYLKTYEYIKNAEGETTGIQYYYEDYISLPFRSKIIRCLGRWVYAMIKEDGTFAAYSGDKEFGQKITDIDRNKKYIDMKLLGGRGHIGNDYATLIAVLLGEDGYLYLCGFEQTFVIPGINKLLYSIPTDIRFKKIFELPNSFNRFIGVTMDNRVLMIFPTTPRTNEFVEIPFTKSFVHVDNYRYGSTDILIFTLTDGTVEAIGNVPDKFKFNEVLSKMSNIKKFVSYDYSDFMGDWAVLLHSGDIVVKIGWTDASNIYRYRVVTIKGTFTQISSSINYDSFNNHIGAIDEFGVVHDIRTRSGQSDGWVFVRINGVAIWNENVL